MKWILFALRNPSELVEASPCFTLAILCLGKTDGEIAEASELLSNATSSLLHPQYRSLKGPSGKHSFSMVGSCRMRLCRLPSLSSKETGPSSSWAEVDILQCRSQCCNSPQQPLYGWAEIGTRCDKTHLVCLSQLWPMKMWKYREKITQLRPEAARGGSMRIINSFRYDASFASRIYQATSRWVMCSHFPFVFWQLGSEWPAVVLISFELKEVWEHPLTGVSAVLFRFSRDNWSALFRLDMLTELCCSGCPKPWLPKLPFKREGNQKIHAILSLISGWRSLFFAVMDQVHMFFGRVEKHLETKKIPWNSYAWCCKKWQA